MHPFFVVNLTLDPTKVDVNVHPQKHEVKFEYERGIYNAIHQAVSNALSKAHIIPEMQFRDQVSDQPFERLSIATQFGSKTPDTPLYVNRLTGEIIHHTDHNPSFQRTDSGNITPQHRTAFEHLFGSEESLIQSREQVQQSPQKILGSMWQLHAKIGRAHV